MKKILLASHNSKKAEEIRALLPKWQVLLPKDLGFSEEAEEKGRTFLENAVEKALFFSRKIQDWLVLADDSGLEVEALCGKPGVHSKRYATPDGDAKKNNAKLLEEMKGIPWEQRRAHFRCAMALAKEGKILFTGEGIVRGYIAEEARGNQGFGYDPLFFYPPFGATFGEVSREEKNQVSHRFLALRTVLEFLKGKI